MNLVTRQQAIADLVNAEGEVSVEALAHRFLVSDMTIRRDLQALADAGRVLRTHGGAAPAQRVMFEFQFLRRAKANQDAKRSIGEVAAGVVRDGQSVLLDSSTTTLAVAERLRERQSLTVITTSLPIASALQQRPGLEVMLLGGYLRPGAPDLVGALTEANLENLRADVAFIGADGVDLKGFIYNASPDVARMLGKMAQAAHAVYAVADSTKIGRTALVRFGQVGHWAGLITDDALDRPARVALRRAGVNLMIASHHKEKSP